MKLFFVLLCLVLIFRYGNFVKHTKKDSSMKYITKQSQNITVPVMIHIDKALFKILIKEYKTKIRNNMKDISKRLLKEVERIFKRANLNQVLKFKLLDTRFLGSKMKKITMDGNASNYLLNYCKWQGQMKILKKKWYYSVLLTGLDLYYTHNGRIMRSSTGRSYMRSVCSIYNSCTLLEWKPKNLDYLLAHEIGHSLGISHDGQSRSCRHNKHIMTPKYNPHNHPKTWSTCSRRDLDMFLRSKRSWCLRPGYDVKLQVNGAKYKPRL
ncbi:A disintegrin and metalloproteinase with thrombospondin motifs adt-2-like [Achroia grisella]|uniref:A disintegrin and metalloproteinase with thrombospondin motifs adt-2-like n=1 Tax=Achroia grisella TaxID=688607 RepID=UPI0027D2ECF4|nr:A disintegrin and metalloproteinase with thrombospondin motifs adt-2-like [Achroia grisella]